MSIPPRLTTKLRGALGEEAAEDLVTWLEEEQSERLALRADVAELRHEMNTGFAKLAAEIKALVTERVHTLEHRIAAVDTRVAEAKADLMKWSFVFWVGAVSAIAMLAGVLP